MSDMFLRLRGHDEGKEKVCRIVHDLTCPRIAREEPRFEGEVSGIREYGDKTGLVISSGACLARL